MSTDADFGERLEAQTATYLDRIDDCVALLPQAFDEYASGGPYRETVDEIAAASKASATTKSGDHGRHHQRRPGRHWPVELATRINFNESALLDFL